VDNSSFSFCKNLSNGVPIIPFYDDKSDRELIYLMEFLKNLATVEDVRVSLEKIF
jgi:CTD small phosphatase-like protein 2